MKLGLPILAGLTAVGLSSCATTKDIAPLDALPPAALSQAKSAVVFVVECDALRVAVHGRINWWDTTVGQGVIFFPLLGPVRSQGDLTYEARLRPLREPRLAAWRAHYLQMLEKHVRLPAATSMVFKIVSPADLRQGALSAAGPAELYVDCTPRFLMGSSYWQWAEPDAVLTALTGPIVIEPAVLPRVSRELANMYEARPSHNTAATSILWQPGKFPFEGCYREHTTMTSPPHKKSRWLKNNGALLDQETPRLLERLAVEVNRMLNQHSGAVPMQR